MQNKIIGALLLSALAIIGIYQFVLPPTPALPEDLLTVGTNAEFRPFTFINQDNEIVGFDIDIAKEIAHRLDKKITIADRSFDMLIPEAQNGSIHFIAAGMTATPQRAEQVIFTKPYLQGEPLVIVSLKKNPPITSLADLNGKDVLVNQGYTADTYISKLQGPIVKHLPTPADAMMDLQTGKSYAYVTAYSAVKPFIEKYGIENFNIFTIADQQENTALAISKKYPELLEKIQPILDQMEADGTIAILKMKWGL